MQWSIEKRARIYSEIARLESLGLTVSQIQSRLGVSKGIVYLLRNGQASTKTILLPYGLTKAEIEVGKLMILGKSNRGIAAALNLSVKNVENRITSIYQKLSIGDDPFVVKRMAAVMIFKDLFPT